MITIDYLLWKYLVPLFRPWYFRSKLFSTIAVGYISIFRMPGIFIRHYFRGRGEALDISTKDAITRNPGVYDLVAKTLMEINPGEDSEGEIVAGQHLVNNPQFKYSVGSFTIHYFLTNGVLKLGVSSWYRYSHSNDRITKYLHRRLNRFEREGRACAFEIRGDEWVVPVSEFSSIEPDRRFRKYANLNILYM